MSGLLEQRARGKEVKEALDFVHGLDSIAEDSSITSLCKRFAELQKFTNKFPVLGERTAARAQEIREKCATFTETEYDAVRVAFTDDVPFIHTVLGHCPGAAFPRRFKQILPLAVGKNAINALAEEARRFLTARVGQTTDPAEFAEYEACFAGFSGCEDPLTTVGAEFVCASLEPALNSVGTFINYLRNLSHTPDSPANEVRESNKNATLISALTHTAAGTAIFALVEASAGETLLAARAVQRLRERFEEADDKVCLLRGSRVPTTRFFRTKL